MCFELGGQCRGPGLRHWYLRRVDPATASGAALTGAASSRTGAHFIAWIASTAIAPVAAGLAAALRDGPADLTVAAVSAAGASALAVLVRVTRMDWSGALAAGLLAAAAFAGAYLLQRGTVPLDAGLLALPVAAAAAGAAAARKGAGIGAARLPLAPLPAIAALVATGQLTPWAVFTLLAVPDAARAAGSALRGEAGGGAAGRAQFRVSAYLTLALLLADPRY